MKKYFILLIFLKIITIDSESYNNLIFKGKCEDDKSKAGACMYYLNNYDSKQNDKYAIFDKCGKGESCDFSYNMCLKDFNNKKRKIGQSCNYDEDCAYGSCVSNECTASKENEKCDKIRCEPGLLVCDYSANKCVKLTKEGDKADKVECMDYLGIDKDNKCVRYGSVADKTDIGLNGDAFICQSGYAHVSKDDSSKKICDSIDTEPVCNDDGSQKTEGKWSDGAIIPNDCTYEEDYNGKKIGFSPKYSKLKSKLYSEFTKDLKDLDLEELNSDGMKWKTYEKWILYDNANELYAAGIIDSDGKVDKNKKCEYEFIVKHIHSDFIKLNTIIIAMIALLLF